MADAVVAVRPGRKFPRDMKKVRVPGFQMQYRTVRLNSTLSHYVLRARNVVIINTLFYKGILR